MENSKKIEWILRIAVAGEFVGHGIFALQGKQAWIDWIHQLTGAEIGTAATLLTLIGLADLLVASLSWCAQSALWFCGRRFGDFGPLLCVHL